MKIIKTLFFLITILLIQNCSEDKISHTKTQNDSDEIKIIAHRGGAKLAPENTIAAINNALRIGVDMIEIDVILSKDNEVIVIHDDTIDRTTSGSGLIKNMSLKEIKEYDAGSWFDPKYEGEKIPTLDEVLETINGNATLLIEIKDGDEEFPGLEKRVIEIIRKYDAKNWIIVQSFNEETVLRVKAMDKEIITYFLLGKGFQEFLENELTSLEDGNIYDKKYNGLALHHSVVNKKNVELIRKMGFKLFVWTVNDINKMKDLILLGVDGIITDLPDKLKEILHK